MRIASPKTLVLVALVAVAVAHPLCARSLVLCVGSDGHVELEPSVDGACTDSGSAASGRAATDTATIDNGVEDHCGECVDLPMVHSAPESIAANPLVRLIVPAEISTGSILPLAAPRAAVDHAFHGCADKPATLTTLRSVRLLI